MFSYILYEIGKDTKTCNYPKNTHKYLDANQRNLCFLK